jgi:hypothetical protein
VSQVPVRGREWSGVKYPVKGREQPGIEYRKKEGVAFSQIPGQ